jgi:hypothetical protein
LIDFPLGTGKTAAVEITPIETVETQTPAVLVHQGAFDFPAAPAARTARFSLFPIGIEVNGRKVRLAHGGVGIGEGEDHLSFKIEVGKIISVRTQFGPHPEVSPESKGSEKPVAIEGCQEI